MSEINGPKFSVNQVNYSNYQRQNIINDVPDSTEENPQMTEYSDPKAEALGRSMVNFKGTDDINNDLKALMENPQIVENSDEIFESAYNLAQEAGVENPYEEAASFSTTAM